MVNKVRLVRQDPLDQQVQQVNQGLRENKGRLETMAKMEVLDPPVHLDPLEHLVIQVTLVNAETLVILEPQDHQDLLGLPEILVQQDQLETQEVMAVKVMLEPQDQWVQLAQQVPKDLQDQQVGHKQLSPTNHVHLIRKTNFRNVNL